MNLYEFFSTPDRGTGDNKKIDTQDLTAKENAERLEDALFWSILDDDYLHKHYFLPLARSIKKQLKTKQADYTDFLKQWYPMVVAGCNAYYKMHALTGDKDEIFDKPLKIRVCKRIAQQFHDDITKDYYKLGESTTEAVKQRIDPTCWKGKHKEGTKIKSGVKVNNCVPNESVDSDMQFDMIEEMVEQIAEEYGVDAEVIWEDFEAVDDITLLETAAWQKKSGKNKTGGLNRKGVMSYRKEHPGSKLQTAVTTPPSKLKPGSKAAKRRKSFCARMGGSKGPMKDKHGKPTRKALALRKWNCRESVNVVEDSSKLDYILVADGKQIYKFRDSGEAEAGLRFMQRKLPQKNFELKHEVCTLQDIGEQQGMAKSSDESRSVRSAKLHFETVDIKIDDVYAYLNERSKVYSDQITSDTYFPGRFINGVRHFVNETAEHVEIKPFIDKLQKLDYDKTIKVGDMFAVLQFDINFASKEIEAFGFVKPKEISDIKIAKNGKIQYITFVDGDKFPRQTPATYEGRPIGIAAYFDSNNAASKALTMLSLSVPDGWELYLSNLSNTTTSAQQQGVAEGFSNDMSTEDMIAYLRQHHDKNLHQDYLNHITSTNIKFVLKNIPINSIRTELSGLDRAKVEQYKQMDFSKAPPIVIGSDGNILDGYHRATVAKALGIPTIKAYVGVKGQQGVAEGWKDLAIGGAMALGALGAGNAHAADLSGYNTQYLQQVASGELSRPMVSIDDAKAELQARANGKQQSTATPQQAAAPKGFSKEYLQKAADPNRFGRYLISVEKAQELLSKMQEGVAVEPDPSGYQKDLLTSPKSTLVIDTPSDLDWYKIGQHYPALGTDDPHEYGQSDSDMVVVPYSEQELADLKQKLDRLKLRYKDIGSSREQPEIHGEAVNANNEKCVEISEEIQMQMGNYLELLNSKVNSKSRK